MKLIDILAPDEMPRNEVSKLVKATRLGESTIRTARRRERISGDTLMRLLLAHGVDPKDIINLPRKKPSRVCPTLTQWNRLGLRLSKEEREAYTSMIDWSRKIFKTRQRHTAVIRMGRFNCFPGSFSPTTRAIPFEGNISHPLHFSLEYNFTPLHQRPWLPVRPFPLPKARGFQSRLVQPIHH